MNIDHRNYKLINSSIGGKLACIQKLTDLTGDILPNFMIPLAPDNTDYQEYLEWVEEGNIPEPADE